MIYDVSLPLVKGAGGCSSGHGKHLVSCYPIWHILWNIPPWHSVPPLHKGEAEAYASSSPEASSSSPTTSLVYFTRTFE